MIIHLGSWERGRDELCAFEEGEAEREGSLQAWRQEAGKRHPQREGG
jgi:hypothetical protein